MIELDGNSIVNIAWQLKTKRSDTHYNIYSSRKIPRLIKNPYSIYKEQRKYPKMPLQFIVRVLRFLTFEYKSTSMRNIRNCSTIKTIIRQSGIVVKNAPSIEHPIPVAVFYRNNAKGAVHWFWPKGNTKMALPKFYNLCCNLGLDSLLAHGKFVVYTDLASATYLQHKWQRG